MFIYIFCTAYITVMLYFIKFQFITFKY